MAPPHFQGSVGGGTSCAQRTSVMLPKKPSKLGFLQHSHPLGDITGYHPNYFLLGFRATPSIPTCKRIVFEGRKVEKGPPRDQGPPRASKGLQEPPRPSIKALQSLQGLSKAFKGPPSTKGLKGPQGPQGALRGLRGFQASRASQDPTPDFASFPAAPLPQSRP